MKREFFLPSFLGFAILVMAQSSYTPLVEAQAQPQQLVCPLSDSQQERAQQAFQEIYDMITSDPPRCINCHGKVQPFANNTTHEGGRINVFFKKGKLLPFFNSKGEPIIDADKTFVLGCILCHDLPFIPPPPSSFWVGRTPLQLCKQFKKRFNNDASRFLDHVRNDEFTLIGFAGTRGLNEVGQAQARNQPYKPEPPSFTQSDLLLWTNIWIDAQGGEFKGDVSCGCEPHHYAITMLKTGMLDNTAGTFHLHADVSGKQDLPLTFRDDGSFTSQATLLTSITETGGDESIPMVCSGEGTLPEQIKATGSVDGVTMHLKISWTSGGSTYSVTCSTPQDTITLKPTFPDINSADVKSPLTDGFDMDAIVGETQTFTIPMPGGIAQLTYTVTIKQID